MNQNSAVTPPQRGDVTPFMGYLVELERLKLEFL